MITLQTVDQNLKVKLPVTFLTRMKIRVGATLHTEIVGDRLILRPVSRRKNYPSTAAILNVQEKIERINKRSARAAGLTKSELDIAIKAELIDKKQAWFWTRGWQKMEREADRSRIFEFENVEEALAFLHK